mmetsp:Transcript_14569/g.31130  ORF Transcript_14569/g.31130 Transcript_14569/m.31130 type:complete len:254 (-) Transcript_14569:150-911(-)
MPASLCHMRYRRMSTSSSRRNHGVQAPSPLVASSAIFARISAMSDSCCGVATLPPYMSRLSDRPTSTAVFSASGCADTGSSTRGCTIPDVTGRIVSLFCPCLCFRISRTPYKRISFAFANLREPITFKSLALLSWTASRRILRACCRRVVPTVFLRVAPGVRSNLFDAVAKRRDPRSLPSSSMPLRIASRAAASLREPSNFSMGEGVLVVSALLLSAGELSPVPSIKIGVNTVLVRECLVLPCNLFRPADWQN